MGILNSYGCPENFLPENLTGDITEFYGTPLTHAFGRQQLLAGMAHSVDIDIVNGTAQEPVKQKSCCTIM